MKKLNYLLKRTLHEIFIWLYVFFDFIIPDFTLFSPLRSFLLKIFTFSKLWISTRIRKKQYLTNINKLKIWKNCFINRWNLFDNNAKITIGDDCGIWYDNKFLTSMHYEKQNIEKKDLDFSTFSKEIIIGNNVWITSNCIILPWSKIWNNTIIASWSVVKWELESNFLYWGVPAKKIRPTQWFISKIK